MTKIAVIIGSVREGRQTDKLANWAANEVAKKAEVEVLDLKDYPLPFFNEAIPPRYNPQRQTTPEVEKWLSKIAEFDGYVVVTPEYNRALPAVLKNAFDTLGNEAVDKPAALIAHGSTGGAQAVASLRMTLPGAGVFTIPNALFFTDHVGEAIDEQGNVLADQLDGPQASLTGLVESLVWYAEALKAAK